MPGQSKSSNPWPSQPAQDAAVITPSDAVNLATPCIALYVGVTGDITLITLAGSQVLFKSVPVGILPVGTSRVNSTGTTASSLIALYN